MKRFLLGFMLVMGLLCGGCIEPQVDTGHTVDGKTVYREATPAELDSIRRSNQYVCICLVSLIGTVGIVTISAFYHDVIHDLVMSHRQRSE